MTSRDLIRDRRTLSYCRRGSKREAVGVGKHDNSSGKRGRRPPPPPAPPLPLQSSPESHSQTPPPGSRRSYSSRHHLFLLSSWDGHRRLQSGNTEHSSLRPILNAILARKITKTMEPIGIISLREGMAPKFCMGWFPWSRERGYLKPSTGGTIIDASCGSGLFSRLFAKSGMFSLVIALDFSENMLQQCYNFINQEGMPRENLILVRADISRLPFVSSSVDAVHAGAAIHCWPSPSAGVAEISRVLRPGGVFVATTFILDVLPPVIPILKTVRQYYIRASSNYLYLSEGELEDLCQTCGLVNFTCVRNGPFVMISATKPS
ncbi:uncharacterized methyltransferase At1g78140, chloroplastic isoform X2 [Musa acuminata AAA Group]|uniref:uncharacterized methyltransferase At1g78140, chloroplastic isoform X2 n=1 Tax=Musa acuminata AAA Group TaxID=214697 RepID=UPI0031E267B8